MSVAIRRRASARCSWVEVSARRRSAWTATPSWRATATRNVSSSASEAGGASSAVARTPQGPLGPPGTATAIRPGSRCASGSQSCPLPDALAHRPRRRERASRQALRFADPADAFGRLAARGERARGGRRGARGRAPGRGPPGRGGGRRQRRRSPRGSARTPRGRPAGRGGRSRPGGAPRRGATRGAGRTATGRPPPARSRASAADREPALPQPPWRVPRRVVAPRDASGARRAPPRSRGWAAPGPAPCHGRAGPAVRAARRRPGTAGDRRAGTAGRRGR